MHYTNVEYKQVYHANDCLLYTTKYTKHPLDLMVKLITKPLKAI